MIGSHRIGNHQGDLQATRSNVSIAVWLDSVYVDAWHGTSLDATAIADTENVLATLAAATAIS